MPPNNRCNEAENAPYLKVSRYSNSQTSSSTNYSSSSDPSSDPSSNSSSGPNHHHLLDLQSSFFNQQSLNLDPDTNIFYSHPDRYNYPATNPTVSTLSTAEITCHLSTLRGHLVNTLTGLRFIEKQLLPYLSLYPSYTSYPSSNASIMQELRNAWLYYVDTNFLNELRGLTRQYPFSEELFQDARGRIDNNPRSWNMAWAMLKVMEENNLIPHHAQQLASRSTMWGGARPKPQHIAELAEILQHKWEGAVEHLLRNWEVFPVYRMGDGL